MIDWIVTIWFILRVVVVVAGVLIILWLLDFISWKKGR